MNKQPDRSNQISRKKQNVASANKPSFVSREKNEKRSEHEGID